MTPHFLYRYDGYRRQIVAGPLNLVIIVHGGRNGGTGERENGGADSSRLRFGELQHAVRQRLRKAVRDSNEADDVVIELLQVLRRNPPLCVPKRTDRMNFVSLHKGGANVELNNESGSAVLHIPRACDLDRVINVRNRVENRLRR